MFNNHIRVFRIRHSQSSKVWILYWRKQIFLKKVKIMKPAIANVPGIAYKAELFPKTDSFCPTLVRKPESKNLWLCHMFKANCRKNGELHFQHWKAIDQMLLKSIEVPKRFREEKTMGNLNLSKNIPESTLQIFTLVV